MNTYLMNRVIVSKPGEGQVLVVGGVKLKVGSTQTGGEFELFELAGPGHPSPHLHRDHDECICVVEGSFTFSVGKEDIPGPAGTVVFVPRGTPHSFTHSEGARALCFVIPANLEGYFRELGEGIATGRPEPEVRDELAGKYDAWPLK